MTEFILSGATTVGRIRNQHLIKRIIYGNTAIKLNKKRQIDGSTHEWTLYVRSYDQDDLSKFIRKVQFKLHDSYTNPIRLVEEPPFEISETGWGEFEVQIKIYFMDVNEKPVTGFYLLRLFEPVFQLANGKEMVVSEYYDEIVFNEPTATMYQALTEQDDFKEHDPRRFYTNFEQIRLRTCEKLKNAKEEIEAEIGDLRATLREAIELIQFNTKIKQESLHFDQPDEIVDPAALSVRTPTIRELRIIKQEIPDDIQPEAATCSSALEQQFEVGQPEEEITEAPGLKTFPWQQPESEFRSKEWPGKRPANVLINEDPPEYDSLTTLEKAIVDSIFRQQNSHYSGIIHFELLFDGLRYEEKSREDVRRAVNNLVRLLFLVEDRHRPEYFILSRWANYIASKNAEKENIRKSGPYRKSNVAQIPEAESSLTSDRQKKKPLNSKDTHQSDSKLSDQKRPQSRRA